MPISRDLKPGDFCHADERPSPPCTINHTLPAVSPLNISFPKNRTHSHSVRVF